jgi:hypothetical protein
MREPATLLRRLGPDGWIGRALATRESPSGDLYLGNSCADWLARGLIRRAAPTVFAGPAAQLVVRHDGHAPPWLRRPGLVFLMDDVWREGDRDPGQSHRFRTKQALLDARSARWHLARAGTVVVSSEPLARAAAEDAPQAEIVLLDPFWSDPLADLAHFDGAGFDMAFLGAHSHQPDLDWLAPALRDALDRLPGATLTLSGEVAAPPELGGHPGLRRIGVTGWSEWRREIARRRFHLALYPLRPTPFNAARSINKIVEHAVAGAPGLYPAHWAPGRAAAAAGAGLALVDDPAEWARAIAALARDRDRLRALAAGARDHAGRINRPEPQRALWARLLLGTEVRRGEKTPAVAGPAG